VIDKSSVRCSGKRRTRDVVDVGKHVSVRSDEHAAGQRGRSSIYDGSTLAAATRTPSKAAAYIAWTTAINRTSGVVSRRVENHDRAVSSSDQPRP